MIGAHDMESGILGGYVEFMRRTQPDAPIPGVYRAEGLFQDAERLRSKMGNGGFFGTLSQGSSSQSGWGELEAGWDAERFENAIVAEPGSEERSQLISALVSTFFWLIRHPGRRTRRGVCVPRHRAVGPQQARREPGLRWADSVSR